MPEPEYTPGPWGPMGNPYLTPEELWTPNRSTMEVSPGLTIGSIHHTEPICRVFGYLLPVVTNARLIAAAPDLVLVVDKLLSFALGLGYSTVDEFQVMTEEARSAIAKARGE